MAEEEDYMGDISQFLPPDQASHSSTLPTIKKGSSSKVSVSSFSDKKRKALKMQEERRLKREQKLIEEDQRTLENLESAIPQSNIGFKLLKQMGYTPGSALGKEGSGRAEPIGIEIRRGRAGIGKEDPKVEKMRREKELAEQMVRTEKEMMEDFGCRLKERWKGKRIFGNFRKAEAALAQLENREIVEVDKEEEDGQKKEEDEEEEVITEEDLQSILMKLRDDHCYCLFCGCQYESTDTLLSDCPGVNEDDH